jgi:hypothetical protein
MPIARGSSTTKATTHPPNIYHNVKYFSNLFLICVRIGGNMEGLAPALNRFY